MTISPISLGNFFNTGSGGTALGGLASGLNAEAVITALTASQSAQITNLQDEIKVNNTQSSALSQLQSYLTALQDAIAPLSNPQSIDTTDNLFAVRTIQINSNTSQAASNYLSATVTSGTEPGSYTISDISQLATNSTQQTTTTFASESASVVAASTTPTSGEFTAGSFTLTGPSGHATVTLNQGDSLSAVAADFNAVSSTTGISASVLQPTTGQYELVFSSTKTGVASAFDLNASGTITDTNTNPVFQNITFGTASSGQDAKFELNGVQIDRASNSISDLISGVTINLLQDTSSAPGASFTLQISPDTSSIEQGIDNFATAYNNFVSFYTQQTQLTNSGTPASASVLYSDNSLRTIYEQMTTYANTIVQNIPATDPQSLAELGITFTTPTSGSGNGAVNDILTIDNSTLESALDSNFQAVENVFGYNLTASSSDLLMSQSSNTQTINNFVVHANPTGTPPTYTATYTDADNNTQTITFKTSSLNGSSTLLTGPSGSGLAGLQLIYSGTTEQDITVSTSQGIASFMNNFLTSSLNTTNGLIALDQQGITTKNTTITNQISTVTSQMTSTREELLQKYAALESSINQANSVLDYLNAQSSTQSSG